LKIKPSYEGKIDILIWICVYGGLLSIVFGMALGSAEPELAWSLGIGGSLATALGIVLIYIRSRKN
jgi:hypothetical protein